MASILRARTIRSLALGGACLLACGATAYAQSAQTSAATAASSGNAVEEVIVTAQKRAENVQNVPLSVTPTTGATLEKLHIQDLKGLNGTVPNLQILVNGGLSLSSMVSIRGIGVTNNPQVYAGTEAAIVIDGVPQGTGQFNLASNFDEERVEILSGPQGTLFGANTTAGVVNIITRQPTGQFGGYGTITVGNYNTFNALVAVNLPLVPDTLSAKVVFDHQGRSGFFTNLYNGSSVDTLDSNTIRTYFKWTPNNRLDVTLASQYQVMNIGSSLLYSISHPGEIAYDPNQKLGFTIWDNVFTPNRLQTQSHTLTANYDSPIGKITSISNYQNYYYLDNLDFMDKQTCTAPGQPMECMNAFGSGSGWQASEELRDVFHPVSNVEWLVGLFAQTWTADSMDGGGITLLPFATLTSFSRGIQDETQRDVSGFTQVYWDVTPRLRLQAGARISWDQVHLFESNRNYTTAPGTIVDAALGFNNLKGASLVPLAPDSPNPPTGAQHAWVNFGGKIGADYKITDDVMAYAFYARGFKTGGFNGAVTVAANIGPFNPEFVDSYEGGIKSEWFDHRLQLNGTIFMNKWNDMQVVQFTFANAANLNSVVLNAGKATSQGVEFTGGVVPFHGLHISTTVGYLDAHYDKFLSGSLPLCSVNPQKGCSQYSYAKQELPYAPKWTGSITGTYDFDVANGDAELSLQYTYTGPKWGNYTQVPDEHLAEVGLLNGNLSWGPKDGNWTVSMWGRNLLNKLYVATALDVPPLFTEATLGNPREFGADFKFKF